MSEDWEDLVLNHRRIPAGRSKKGGKASGRHGAGVFYPKQALGAYVLCSDSGCAEGYMGKNPADQVKALFEIHDFTARAGGFIGSLDCANGRLRAAVLLAGSRNVLQALVEDEDDETPTEDESEEADENSHTECDARQPDGGDEDDRPESAMEAADRFANDRVQVFAKNSFRQPKFWFQWQGEVLAGTDKSPAIRERNLGYIVFHGNDCQAFNGTIDCKALQWKNLQIIGRKIIPAARPPSMRWRDFELNDGVGGAGECGSGNPF